MSGLVDLGRSCALVFFRRRSEFPVLASWFVRTIVLRFPSRASLQVGPIPSPVSLSFGAVVQHAGWPIGYAPGPISDFPCCLSISCSGAVAHSFHFFLHQSLVASLNQWSHELSVGAVSLPPLVFKWSAPKSTQTLAGLTKREALCRAAVASVPSVPILRCCL
jgi:hypothetical protein